MGNQEVNEYENQIEPGVYWDCKWCGQDHKDHEGDDCIVAMRKEFNESKFGNAALAAIADAAHAAKAAKAANAANAANAIIAAEKRMRLHLLRSGLTPIMEPRREGWFHWPHLSLASYHDELRRAGESTTHREVWLENKP